MIADPIARILWDHERQLAMCGKLEFLVDDLFHHGYQRTCCAILDHLTHDFIDHIADEHDLFDMLATHYAYEASFKTIFELLRDEHVKDQRLVAPIVRDLATIIDRNKLPTPLNFLMNGLAFIETQRRHIAWENATVVPFAVTNLTKENIDRLARRMTARRTARDPESLESQRVP